MVLRIFICLILSFFSQSINAINAFWNGSVNDNWFNTANWNGGFIPSINDEVFIQGANAVISINGNARCKRIYNGGSNLNMTIKIGASLLIDAGMSSVDGIYLSDGSVINNGGTITIQNIQTANWLAEAVDNHGEIINSGDFVVKDMIFTGSVAGVKDAILNNPGASFINYKSLKISTIPGIGINNLGEFENKADGIIDLATTISGVRIYNSFNTNNTGAIFTNYGSITSAGRSTTITNWEHGEFNNYGDINIQDYDTTAGLYSISNHEVFNNFSSGEIILSAAKQLGNGTFSQVGAVFTNDGLIQASDQSTGVGNSRFNTFINNGHIIVDNCIIGISAGGNFTNNNNITLTNLERSGLSNTGTFTNNDIIFIEHVDEPIFPAMRNIETFINNSGGSIIIRNSDGSGLDNTRVSNSGPAAQFFNYGSLLIEDTGTYYGLRSLQDSKWTDFGSISINSNSRGIVNTAEMKIKGVLYTPYFYNTGDLEISGGPSFLDVSGDFEANGNSKIKMDASGHTLPGFNYDQIRVQGNLKIGGSLELVTSSGYFPNSISSFDLITHNGDIQGYLDTFFMTPTNSNFSFRYDFDNKIVVDFDECLGNDLTNYYNGVSGNWNDPFAWSLGHVPKACEQVIIAGAINNPKIINVNTSNAKCKSLKLIQAEMVVSAGAVLTIDPLFEHTSQYIGLKGMTLEFSKLENFGTIEISHVTDTKAMELNSASELENYGEINFGRMEGLPITGLLNRGLLINGTSGNISTTIMNPTLSSTAIGFSNFGEIQNDGDMTTNYWFYNTTDSSTYAGNGTVSIDTFINKGIIQPGASAGKMTFNGDLKLDSTGLIIIEIFGNGNPGVIDGYDQININGNLQLGGDIDLTLMNGYKPSVNNRFNIFNYTGQLNEDFINENKSAFINAWDFSTVAPQEINLVSTRNCAFQSVTWTGIVSDKWTDRNNWDKGFIPLGCHDVYISNRPNQAALLSGTSAEIHSLIIEDESLIIQNGASLLVDGLGNGINLVSLENAVLNNFGQLNIQNSDKPISWGIRIDKNSAMANLGMLNISDIMGSNSYGLLNYGAFSSKGIIDVQNVPSGTGLQNALSTATFIMTSTGSIFIEACNLGIINAFEAKFNQYGRVEIQNNITRQALVNSNSTYKIFATGLFTGVSNSGLGILNQNSAILENFGRIE
jgi:hypothetical protein